MLLLFCLLFIFISIKNFFLFDLTNVSYLNSFIYMPEYRVGEYSPIINPRVPIYLPYYNLSHYFLFYLRQIWQLEIYGENLSPYWWLFRYLIDFKMNYYVQWEIPSWIEEDLAGNPFEWSYFELWDCDWVISIIEAFFIITFYIGVYNSSLNEIVEPSEYFLRYGFLQGGSKFSYDYISYVHEVQYYYLRKDKQILELYYYFFQQYLNFFEFKEKITGNSLSMLCCFKFVVEQSSLFSFIYVLYIYYKSFKKFFFLINI